MSFAASTYHTHSAEETIELGQRLAAEIQPPRWILLVGDLGTGKTTLAKGLISGFGAAPVEEILSPTFSLIHEYEGPPKLYHIDLYRLDRVAELETLGLEELEDQPAIVLIEWGEKFESQLPGKPMKIRLTDLGGDHRGITLEAG